MSLILEQTAVIFFALTLVGGLVALLTLRNLIRGVFAFFVVLFSVAGLFALNNAGFVAVSQIIIYVGGILLLTLFGVMLTHRGINTAPAIRSQNSFIGIGVAMLVLGGAILAFKDADFSPKIPRQPVPHNPIQEMGVVFLTDYLIIFEFLSLFLLIAVIGAVYIAQQNVRTKNSK